VPTSADDVYFTNLGTNGCTVDAAIDIASLNIAAGYTGTFDNATNNQAITIAGDVIMDGSAVSMGAATWTTSGSFDCKDVGTFNRNASTLVMNGTGKNLSGVNAYTGRFNSITVNGDTIITTFTYSSGNLNVNATLTLSVSIIFYSYGPISVGAGKKITGAGELRLVGNSGRIATMDGTIDNVSVWIRGSHTTNPALVAGTYDWPTIYVKNDAVTNDTKRLGSGNIILSGNLYVQTTGTGTLTLDNATDNPNITVKGNLTISENTGVITWTKGTGTLTFNGTTAQAIDFMGLTVEAINVTNTSAIVTFATNGFTGTSLTASAGASMKFQATKTFAFTTLSLDGTSGSLITLASTTGGSAFLFNITTAPTVSYVSVSDSNASGGAAITTSASTDGGGNTNWIFFVPKIINY